MRAFFIFFLGDLLCWCLYSSEHVFFNARDGTIRELYRYLGTSWKHRNLTAELTTIQTYINSPTPSPSTPHETLFEEAENLEVVNISATSPAIFESSNLLNDSGIMSRVEILPNLGGHVGIASQMM